MKCETLVWLRLVISGEHPAFKATKELTFAKPTRALAVHLAVLRLI